MNINEMLFEMLNLKSFENISNGLRDKIINDSRLKGLSKESILENIIETVEDMGLPNDIKESLISRAKKDFGEQGVKKTEEASKSPKASLEDIVNIISENCTLVSERLKRLTTVINFLDNKVNERNLIVGEEFARIDRRIDVLFKKLGLEH